MKNEKQLMFKAVIKRNGNSENFESLDYNEIWNLLCDLYRIFDSYGRYGAAKVKIYLNGKVFHTVR